MTAEMLRTQGLAMVAPAQPTEMQQSKVQPTRHHDG